MNAKDLSVLAEAWARLEDPDDRDEFGIFVRERVAEAAAGVWETLARGGGYGPGELFLAHLAVEQLAFDRRISPAQAWAVVQRDMPLTAETAREGA